MPLAFWAPLQQSPAKTIDQIPLDWCFGPGVVLDLRHKTAGELISPPDLAAALARIDYTLEPGDIVLLMTGADKHIHQPDYFSAHAGMGKESTAWLLDQGIRVIGIDSWGFDRPAGAMLSDYLQTKHTDAIFPATCSAAPGILSRRKIGQPGSDSGVLGVLGLLFSGQNRTRQRGMGARGCPRPGEP